MRTCPKLNYVSIAGLIFHNHADNTRPTVATFVVYFKTFERNLWRMTEVLTENVSKFNAKFDKSHLQLRFQQISQSSRVQYSHDTHIQITILLIRHAMNLKFLEGLD